MYKFFEIRGRKVLTECFMREVDKLRWKFHLDYINRLVYGIQEVVDSYQNECNDISHLDDFLRRFNYELPEITKLPEAIECLFQQLENKSHQDLSYLLDNCVIRSQKEYQHFIEEQTKEKKRLELVENLNLEDHQNVEKVKYLLQLQLAKSKSNNYDLSNEEIKATNFLCELLIVQLSSQKLPYHLMKRAVENKYVEDSDITKLLKEKYEMKQDYEWYDEDFIGCDLDILTCIQVNDLLELCLDKICKTLAIDIHSLDKITL